MISCQKCLNVTRVKSMNVLCFWATLNLDSSYCKSNYSLLLAHGRALLALFKKEPADTYQLEGLTFTDSLQLTECPAGESTKADGQEASSSLSYRRRPWCHENLEMLQRISVFFPKGLQERSGAS